MALQNDCEFAVSQLQPPCVTDGNAEGGISLQLYSECIDLSWCSEYSYITGEENLRDVTLHFQAIHSH